MTPEERRRLRLDVTEPAPPVLADPERIERVIVNLLTNAFRYVAPGTPVVVKLRPREGGSTVSVTDQGPGIPRQELPHLFQRYRRVAGAKTASGLGLGLYISRLIVESHGGRIWAESTPGQGSTFSFSLPAA